MLAVKNLRKDLDRTRRQCLISPLPVRKQLLTQWAECDRLLTECEQAAIHCRQFQQVTNRYLTAERAYAESLVKLAERMGPLYS